MKIQGHIFNGHLIDSIHLRILENRWRLLPFLPKLLVKNQTIDRPIFLLGTQGGGLTFLGRVLRRSKGVFSFAADRRYWNSADEMHIHMDTGLPETLRLRHSKALTDLKVSEVFNYANDRCLHSFRYTPEDVQKHDRDRLKHTIKGLQYLIASKGYTPRFMDKSQSYTIKTGYLNALLEGCNPHFLLVARNPLAICSREAFKIKEAGASQQLFEKRLVECAEHWNNSFKYALADAEKYDFQDRIKFVRIEDVLQSPDSQVKEICEFLGLEYSPTMLPSENDTYMFPHTKDNKWYPIRVAANERYIEKLNQRDIRTILESCSALMNKLGYSHQNLMG